jgi:hypothetical protein
MRSLPAPGIGRRQTNTGSEEVEVEKHEGNIRLRPDVQRLMEEARRARSVHALALFRRLARRARKQWRLVPLFSRTTPSQPGLMVTAQAVGARSTKPNFRNGAE